MYSDRRTYAWSSSIKAIQCGSNYEMLFRNNNQKNRKPKKTTGIAKTARIEIDYISMLQLIL